MKIIKLAIISFVVLFLLMTAMLSLLPRTIRISRAININASREQVRARLVDLQGWSEWNEYVKAMNHPQVKADSIYSDQLSIAVRAIHPASVETAWHQQRNGKTFPGVFNLIQGGSVTAVQWYFDFHFKWYPWEKLSSITYDKQIGPQMEQSLENLKRSMEKPAP
ncbi:MAG: SRPBCC family protein [Williamsia sp.]|nr:SRPBCC family protein [Williamsia sp.]